MAVVIARMLDMEPKAVGQCFEIARRKGSYRNKGGS
jgi:hypothetical protein